MCVSSKSADNFCFSPPLHASHRKKIRKYFLFTLSILESFTVKKASLNRFSIKNAEEKNFQEKVIVRKDRNPDITMSIS